MDITLAGKEYTLKVTMAACDKIEKRFGGITDALEASGKMNTDTLATIISCGANIGQREFKDLKNDVFDHGILNVTPIVVEFLGLMLDPTGKDKSEDDDDEEGEA